MLFIRQDERKKPIQTRLGKKENYSNSELIIHKIWLTWTTATGEYYWKYIMSKCSYFIVGRTSRWLHITIFKENNFVRWLYMLSSCTFNNTICIEICVQVLIWILFSTAFFLNNFFLAVCKFIHQRNVSTLRNIFRWMQIYSLRINWS